MFDFDAFKEKASAAVETTATAAKRLAGNVKTNITIYSEEERLKGIYQAIGKLVYEAQAEGASIESDAMTDLYRQAADTLRRIDLLRAQENVSGHSHAATYTEETVSDADFADL